MSKTAAIVSLSPLKFVPGSQVLADDVTQIIEALNYAAAQNPEYHGGHYPAMVVPPAVPITVDNSNPQWTPLIRAIYADDPGGGWMTRYDWWFRVDNDVRALHFYCECDVPISGDTMDVKLSIDGVDQSTLTFHFADNGTVKDFTVATTTGGGSINSGERRGRLLIQSPGGASGYDGQTFATLTAANHASNVLTLTFSASPGLVLNSPVRTTGLSNPAANVTATVASVSGGGTIITIPIIHANMGNVFAGGSTVSEAYGLLKVPSIVAWSLQEDAIDPATFPSPGEDVLSVDG